MKRFLAIILLLTYTAASMGMSVDVDYCCGEVAGLSVALEYVQDGNRADKNTEDGCCASTHLDLKKIEDKQLASEQIKLKLAPVVAVALLPQVPFYKYLKGASERSFVARVWQVASAPPRLPACRQALFCTFRV